MLLASGPRLDRCADLNSDRPAERLPAGYEEADVAILRWIQRDQSANPIFAMKQ